jgi:D-glycero-D-manno-heptose 1,7-bisphosphate phosphatase
MAKSLKNPHYGELKTVFLDRDGVLNKKLPEGRFISSWEEFKPLPGVAEAIVRLNRAGVRVFVVSNQRGIALGLYSIADVEAIHHAFQELLKAHGGRVDGFYFCPHDKLQCNCRKPLPGLFQQAAADFPDLAPKTCIMIGDSVSDIEFGCRLGMSTVFVEGEPELRKPGAEAAREMADLCVPTLAEAVNAILASREPTGQQK